MSLLAATTLERVGIEHASSTHGENASPAPEQCGPSDEPRRPATAAARAPETDTSPRPPAAGGSLRPAELAEAAVLAAVAVVIVFAGRIAPAGSELFFAAAVAPFAALALRRRLRALLAGAWAAAVLAFVVGGPPLLFRTAGAALVGLLLGAGVRRGWGNRRTLLLASLALWVAVSALLFVMLAVFDELRRLSLDQIQIGWNAPRRGLLRLDQEWAVRSGDALVAWVIRYWWAALPLLTLPYAILLASISDAVVRPVLRRLDTAFPRPVALPLPPQAGEPGPLPVALEEVHVRYPGATEEALAGVTLTLFPASFVAVVGENGSGKSTLARVLAGLLPPTEGTLRRPGAAAPGRPGGTAFVAQRPESQVLSARVRDDLLWGLPPDEAIDIHGLLALAGLAGFEERETATLSGGELQRLAIAAALARRPALLISDEATAMLDAEGRRSLTGLLRRLPGEHGIAVVHVTHRHEEARPAQRVIRLAHGCIVADGPPAAVLGPARAHRAVPAATNGPARAASLMDPDAVTSISVAHAGGRGRRRTAAPLVRLESVGHVYARGTPWARRALAGVDLTIAEGERIILAGANGSGKSTLAWVLAGLIRPTDGRATLGERPLHEAGGAVAIAFQHARLQLFRPTVAADIRFGTEALEWDVDEVLRLVGLDPTRFRSRRIDALSGGEQRRVALAGLLLRRPRLLILDEPLAGLDATAADHLIDVLERLRARTGLATVIVSHDLEEATRFGDRLVVLRDGAIVSDAALRSHPETTWSLPEAGK